MVRNLRHAIQKWARLTHILIRGGADAQTSGQIYLAVVQSVLLYGSKTWVLTPHMKRVLGGFHHGMDLRLTGQQPWKGWDRVWDEPPMEYAMAEAGLQELETYVYYHRNTAAQYIATRPIMGLCLATKRRPVERVAMRWWEQEGLDLEGM